MSDWELLQQFVQNGSRTALEELIRRHLSMVYAAALREVADPHLAEDVTQAVFIVLMRRASHISSRIVLAGWLFNTTRFVASDAKKMNARRTHHEREAAAMHATSYSDSTDSAGEHIQPILNDALASLPQKYRDAVVMAYLEGKSHHEVAVAQRLTENAARQRLSRGIAKLRGYFARKNLAFAEGVLGTDLIAASAETAPAFLADHIFTTLNTSASGNASLIAQHTVRRMIMFKIKTAAVAMMTLIIVGVTVRIMFAQVSAGPTSPSTAQSTTPTTAPTTQSAVDPSATPQDILVLARRNMLAGDEQKALSLFDNPTAAEKNKLRRLTELAAAVQKVADAASKKFGNDIHQQMLDAVGLDVSETDLKNANVTIDGDTAVADVGNAGPGKIPMVKTADGWRISSAVIDTFDSRELAQMRKLLPPLHQMSQDIDAGKYADADALEKALAQLLSGPPAAAQH